jgi:hypothetical protein
VITTVPESLASDLVIMELYRVRWQIELEFKRLKSLLRLDTLPSKQGPTARSWILARVLAAILVERLLRDSGAFPPGDIACENQQSTENTDMPFPLPETRNVRSASKWALFHIALWVFRVAVLGPIQFT